VDEVLGRSVLSWTNDELAADLSGDLRDKAKALALRVVEARTILGSPADRIAYRQRLERGSKQAAPAGDESPDIDEAAMYYDKGRGFLRTNDFREAAAEFDKAVDLDPHSARYLAYCGWARYRSVHTENDAEVAVAMLDRALEIDGRCPIAHFFLGSVHKDHRRYARAAACFEAAVRYDPGFELARNALREAGELSGMHRRMGVD
jgi:tetratricopeptide (TPR) repeat protein